jgi:hypothetical protein
MTTTPGLPTPPIPIGFDPSTTPCCRHCGAHDYFPSPGAFAPIASVFGFFRYTCRTCRRSFWRHDGDEPGPVYCDASQVVEPSDDDACRSGEPDFDDADEAAAGLAPEELSLVELDEIAPARVEVGAGVAPAADLRALDRAVARAARRRDASRGGRCRKAN